MLYCDLNPTVEVWTSEYPIKYYSKVDQRVRRYFIDFIVKLKDGRTLAIEIKPYSQTIPPVINKRKKKETLQEELLTFQVNQDKWSAASEWCERRGFQFLILTERDLGIGNSRTASK